MYEKLVNTLILTLTTCSSFSVAFLVETGYKLDQFYAESSNPEEKARLVSLQVLVRIEENRPRREDAAWRNAVS